MTLSEIQTRYKGLSLKLRDDIFRKSIDERELSEAISCLEELFESCNKDDFVESNFISTTEAILKCLRNSCVSCERNQNIIMNTSAVSITLNILQKTLEQNKSKEGAKNIQDLQTVSIQFLGNLVSGNASCQEIVWKEILPQYARFFLEKLEYPINDLFCMVIFNCIRNRSNVIYENGFVELIALIAELCKKNHTEWSLFIMENIISREDFIDLYRKMDKYHEQRLIFLDLLLAFLDGESLDIPEGTLLSISDVFEKSAQSIACSEFVELDNDFTQTVELLLRYLRILCTATVFRNKYDNLLKKQGCLEHTVYLLRAVSENTKQSARTLDRKESVKENSVSGFKVYLVRIIGNMCYEDTTNQNKVRELGGLPIILDNCRIDDNNPYLCQWAIFAVRNLCKGNLENQKLISEMEMRGIADNELLRRQGIEPRLENGRIRVRMGGTDV